MKVRGINKASAEYLSIILEYMLDIVVSKLYF